MVLNKKYARFSDFKRRVLEPAKKELQINTPIRFIYTTEKRGKSVISITFTVFDNDDYKAEKLPHLTIQMMLELKETENPEERKRIIWSHVSKHLNHDVWDREYKKFLKQGRTPEKIDESAKWAASEIDRRSKTHDPIKDPVGYVCWAISTGKP